jgi:hypothetical protein
MCFGMAALAGCGGSVAAEPSSSTDGGNDGPVVNPRPEAGPMPYDASHEAAAEAEAGPTYPLGKNISMASSIYEAEDQIAVAPDGTIGIVWTGIPSGPGYVVMGYTFSTDDGATFTPPQYITLPGGLAPSDPGITTDAQGNFYASILGLHVGGQSVDYDRVYLAVAKKGTTTFGPVTEATDPTTQKFNDHPKVIVTAKGTIAIGFLQADSIMVTQSVGLAATSTDGGMTWTRSKIVGQPEAQFANLFWFCEGAGALYVTYLEATQNAYGVALRKSTDEGLTWSAMPEYANLPNELPAGLDPECVASGQDVWVGYGTTPSPSTADTTLDLAWTLEVAHSGDGGDSFDAARAPSLDGAASKRALLPILVREDTGTLDSVYIAGDSDGDPMGSVRFTQSAKGGPFGASAVIDQTLLFTTSRTSRQWLGDYFGAVAHAGALYVAYPMNESNGTAETHIFFRRVSVSQ